MPCIQPAAPHPHPRAGLGQDFRTSPGPVRTASAPLHRKPTPRWVGGRGWGEDAPAGRKRGVRARVPFVRRGTGPLSLAHPPQGVTRALGGLPRVSSTLHSSSLVEAPRDTGSGAIGLRGILSCFCPQNSSSRNLHFLNLYGICPELRDRRREMGASRFYLSGTDRGALIPSSLASAFSNPFSLLVSSIGFSPLALGIASRDSRCLSSFQPLCLLGRWDPGLRGL